MEYSRQETLPQSHTDFCNKHNLHVWMMWADRYLKNALQLKFRKIVEFAHIVPETLKISSNTKYSSSIGQFGTCTVN